MSARKDYKIFERQDYHITVKMRFEILVLKQIFQIGAGKRRRKLLAPGSERSKKCHISRNARVAAEIAPLTRGEILLMRFLVI